MARANRAPPQLYFVGSAVFHYLGPAFAVLLFARVGVLGVAWLRIVSAALVFAAWRRPWRAFARLDADGRRTLLAWGAVLAVMNCCFYEAIDRLPLGTVAAIEFLPVVALAALGARTARNAAALVLAVGGVYLLTHVRIVGEPLGLAFAFANAALFASYIVLGHRVARAGAAQGVDGLAASMLVAALVVLPIGAAQAAPAFLDPTALAAGVGVGVASSVIPYVCDQLALARLQRATYALMVSLLPATATVIGIVVLAQVPSGAEVLGVALVVAGVGVHRETPDLPGGDERHPGEHGEHADLLHAGDPLVQERAGEEDGDRRVERGEDADHAEQAVVGRVAVHAGGGEVDGAREREHLQVAAPGGHARADREEDGGEEDARADVRGEERPPHVGARRVVHAGEEGAEPHGGQEREADARPRGR